MNDKTELLPCPFCGSAAEFETIPAGALAKCPGCGVAMMNGGIGVGWYETRELAAADWNRRAASAQQPAQAVPDGWKLVPVDPTEEMLSAMTAYDGNYYTHPFDQDDFAKDYAALLAAAPAAPVAQEPSTFWVLFDATADKKHIKKMIPDGTLAFFDCESDALRAKARNPGTDYKRVDYYTAPPAAEQPECVTCSGHGLVGNRLDDGEECPECHGAGIIYGTECGACAEQPDTVAVPRELLEQAEDIIESYAESLKACHAPGGEWGGDDYARDDYEHEAGVASKLRDLLAGGAE